MEKIIIAARAKDKRWLGCRLPINLCDRLEALAQQTGYTKTELTIMALQRFLASVEVEPASQGHAVAVGGE